MREYGDAILDCLTARGVWEPGESVVPGDYGQIEQGCFMKLGSVTQLGVKLEPHEETSEGKYEFSRGLDTQQSVSAKAKVEWTGEVISSIQWSGGAGLFLGASKSKLLTISNLGRVVRETLLAGGWGFNWRLVRQVRILNKGIVILGGNSSAAGKLLLSTESPGADAGVSAGVQRSDGFVYVQRDVNGAVYAHVVRLRPWLTHGAAPLDHELWYDDTFDDE